ncbi:DUF6318 family protein [Specibacter sp. RAF43]|uniref:DUF6318 family protein n=1 Tax=Specibacter sp. RAF43 TaxID=3233057 RepID=UPI003F9AAB4E
MTTRTLRSQSIPARVRPRWKRRFGLARHLGLVLVAGLLLAGCAAAENPGGVVGTSGQPPALTITATTPAVTPSPVPVYKPATADGPAENVPVPVLPAAAKEFSKKGLEAFTRYWYSTLGYAFETGNTGPMMKVSDSNCQMCHAMEQGVIGGHSDGKWIVGGQMIVLSADSPFVPTSDGNYQTISMVRQDHVKYFKANKSLAKDLGVAASIGDILVGKYEGDHWIAITVGHLSGSKK